MDCLLEASFYFRCSVTDETFLLFWRSSVLSRRVDVSRVRANEAGAGVIVQTNPTQELSEFYPPPYNFLGPQRRPKLHFQNGTCPYSRCACKRRGMGQTTSGLVSQTAGTAASVGSATAGLLVAAGAIQAVPIAGQIAGAALVVTAIIASMFKGCGSSCILTTNEVNQVEPYMQQNLAQYLAAPVSAATQQEALANFSQLWQGVLAYCQQPSMAQAGKNCISDRQQGSCAYKTSPGGWQQNNGVWTYQYPGPNGSGSSCWNWFVGYHDPIANDPRVAEAAATAANVGSNVPAGNNAGSSVPGSTPLGWPSWLLPVGLIGGGLLFFFGGDL